MSIDIAFLIVLIFAAIKGFSRGLIMAIFSFAGLFIGLAAALKLSAVVANYFQESTDKVPSTWWPFIAFILVFLFVVALVSLAGKAVEKTLELSTLGWVNRIGGFLIYAIMYTLLFSVVLFFLVQMNLLGEKTISDSVVYGYVQPWGPWMIAGLSKIIPAFKDVFTDLQEFFDEIGQELKK